MYELGLTLPKGLNILSDELSREFCSYLISRGSFKKLTDKRKDLCKTTIGVFLGNSVSVIKSGKFKVHIPLDKNVYSSGYIQNGRKLKSNTSYQYTKWLLESLEENGWGYLVKGGQEYEGVFDKKTRKHKATLVRSSISYFYFNQNKQELLSKLFSKVPTQQLKNVIIVRDEKGINTTYKGTSYSKEVRENTNTYNNAGALTLVRGKNQNNSIDVQVRRVFNMGSFYIGGRHYCSGIQTLSKKERLQLTIEGNSTVVYDYKSFEPAIAYEIISEVMEGDPYLVEVDNYSVKVLRDVGKLILLRLFYASNDEQVIFSVNNEIHDNWDLSKLVAEGDIPDKIIPVREILDKMTVKHYKISEFFYGGGDVHLPHIGSEIIDYILQYFLQNHGSVVLPVFDELIAEHFLEEDLKEVMFKAWRHVLKTDYNCRITKEK